MLRSILFTVYLVLFSNFLFKLVAVQEVILEKLKYWQDTQKEFEEKLKCFSHKRNKSVGAQQLKSYVGQILIRRYKEGM